MKILTLLLGCFLLSPLVAQTPAKPGLGPSPLEQKRAEAAKAKKEHEKEKKKQEESLRDRLREKLKETPALYPEEGTEYTHPGVVILNNGEWEGTDNIYNIPKNISIGVEFVVPDENTFPVKAESIRNRVKGAFQSAGIVTQALMSGDKPPLPLFNIVLIAQNINKGYVIYCAANLLEEVDVKRAKLNSGTWQAITWDRQHLLVTPTEETAFHLNKCIDDIALAFLKVYRHYQGVKSER